MKVLVITLLLLLLGCTASPSQPGAPEVAPTGGVTRAPSASVRVSTQPSASPGELVLATPAWPEFQAWVREHNEYIRRDIGELRSALSMADELEIEFAGLQLRSDGESMVDELDAMRPARCYEAAYGAYRRVSDAMRVTGASLVQPISPGPSAMARAVESLTEQMQAAESEMNRARCGR